MVQTDILKLLQQGDVGAVTRFLNRSLQPRGVVAKVLLREQRLKILLSSDRPLDQKAFVRLIQQQIDDLEISSIASVKVYSQRLGEAVPDWSQEFVPLHHKAPLPVLATPKGSMAIVKLRTESQDFLNSLGTFQVDSIFPFREVFSRELYRSNTVRSLLFLGLFPLVINLLAKQVSLEQIAWLIGIYSASVWGVVLHNLIKPVQFSWRNTLKCILFTTVIGIPLLLIFQQVPPFRNLYHAINAGPLYRLIGFILGVGVLEEICKALPIYFLLARPQKLQDPLTSAFYGAMSGLGFAIAEGAAYSFRYAAGLSRGQLDLSAYMAANTIRFVSLPLFHAMLAGIVGYFIGLAVINPSRRSAIVFIGIMISATLHGLYNMFAGGLPGLMIVAFTILLFVTYLRRSQHLVDEMHLAEQRAAKRGSRNAERGS